MRELCEIVVLHAAMHLTGYSVKTLNTLRSIQLLVTYTSDQASQSTDGVTDPPLAIQC